MTKIKKKELCQRGLRNTRRAEHMEGKLILVTRIYKLSVIALSIASTMMENLSKAQMIRLLMIMMMSLLK